MKVEIKQSEPTVTLTLGLTEARALYWSLSEADGATYYVEIGAPGRTEARALIQGIEKDLYAGLCAAGFDTDVTDAC